MRTAKWCTLFVALLCASTSTAHAAFKFIANVALGEVGVIAVPTGTPIHKPGNLNISIEGGFSLTGLTCTDNVYLTTLASVDPDRSMLQLLIAALTNGQRVNLIITDDPQYNAYPGICSITQVSVLEP